MKTRYQFYKDSGVEWIGEIPEHWVVTKVKHCSKIFGRIGFRGYAIEDIVDEGEGAITLSPGNIVNNNLNLSTKTYLSWEKYYESPEIQIFGNDILIVTTGSTIGKSCLIPSETPEMTINPQLIVLKTVKLLNKYLFYQLTCDFIQRRFVNEQTGSSTPTISQAKIGSFLLVKPPTLEQTQIVEFLDEKTSLIDKLISVKQRKIELLKEKRTALINHVVTKGLDPNVKMKDSGIEWIGEIPEHWVVKKTTYCFSLIGSGTTPTSSRSEYYEGGEVNWLQTGDLTDNLITKTSKLITKKALSDFNLKIYPSNSLIIAMYGATIGKVGLLKINTATNQACCVLAEPIGVYINYVFYWFIANKIRIVSLAYGGGQPNISMETIKFLRIPNPLLSEQTQIVEYLDEKTKEIDELVSLEQKKIDLLREYRESLISEVVTGKIKVTTR
ncbi:MAG: restriction endonuclease subunit S [Ignavibacteriaceae bacterium]|nr:restriction endonuclease subunit S [Ignavibacteriaceae bacterium]